jgi:hypothetical protein
MQPTPSAPSRPYRVIRQRPWAAVSWWYSLLFAVPMVILLVMGVARLFGGTAAAAEVAVAVTDSATGQPLQGAIVTVGDQQVSTNDKGIASVTRPDAAQAITVQAVDYEPMWGTIDQSSKTDQSVALRSTTISGVLTDATTGQPIAGARIIVMNADGPTEISATTGADGSYTVKGVPAGATIQAESSAYQTTTMQPTGGNSANIAMAPAPTQEVAENTPTPEATVEATEADPGTANLPKVPDVTKGIYLSANAAADPATLDSIIDLVNTTELNTVVLDIKEGSVWYDSNVAFFKDAGAVDPIYDAEAVVQKLHDNGIYVIGRLVVFNDPVVAEAYPELAIPAVGGGLWLGADGNPWVNPFKQELWQANIDLAVEAVNLGFDEIQYDYIRFPSDGDLNTADFPSEYEDMDGRVAAISGFLELSLPQVHAAGAWQSADVFGIVAVYDDDQGIGQYLRDIYQHLDFVSPMVYPSHWDEGSIPVDGIPNDHPGEVISVSIAMALDKMDGEAGMLRPWLQDFSLGGMTPYGPDQVREQIDAAEAAGVEGWLLWNSGGGTNNEAALNPEP